LQLTRFGSNEPELHTGGDNTSFVAVADGALWVERGSSGGKLMAWHAGGEVRALSGLADGVEVRSVGSDAQHVVLTVKPDKADPMRCEVVSAPFAQDADRLEARTVTSIPCIPSGASWVVGCGYAAAPAKHPASPESVLVRLKDGQRWQLSQRVVGISCKEVFSAPNPYQANGAPALIAQPLDALGTGEAPSPK